MQEFLQGFALQASLILALGAQNLFVLDCGLRRQHHFFVAAVCSVCDAILILAGVLGSASVFIRFPILKISFGVLGVGFLLFYGVKKILERPAKVGSSDVHPSRPLKKTFYSTLAFSLLNPHVYLDTVVLIGSYAAKFERFSDRTWFGVGALSFSCVWFFCLVLLASSVSRFFRNPKTMRLVNLIAGSVLVCLAVKLGMDVYRWAEF